MPFGVRVGRVLDGRPDSRWAKTKQFPPDWFDLHYEWAADQIGDFLGDAGIRVEGAHVADIGCGDGIIDLGLVHRWKPASVIGFDVDETDVAHLAEVAGRAGIAYDDPASLSFVQSGPVRIPSEEDCFDLVLSWSAFEHVADPRALIQEVRRVLKPGCPFFCQILPLYHSKHGSHLQRWFPEGFVQFDHTADEILASMHERDPAGGEVEYMWSEYESLNQMTLDEFGAHLAAVGFRVTHLELLQDTFDLPPELSARYPLSVLATAGFKLIAV